MTNIFDLQLFAEGDAAEAPAAADVDAGADITAEPEAKESLNEIDVDAKINAAISKITAKLEADYKRREAAAKKEAERLGKLSDDERQKAELENARKELAEKEAALKRKEIELETTKVLEQRGLPVGFMPYFITDDNEETLDRIKVFEKEYKKAIDDGVSERIKGRAPTTSAKLTDVTGYGKVSKGFMDAIRAKQLNP